MVSLAGLAGGASTVNIVINGVDNFSNTFGKASSMLGSIGKIAGTALVGGVALAGTAMAGLGITAVNTAADFESAFTGVRKTVDLTESQFAELENRFKDITETTPITFQELSSIGEIAGQLGVEGVDNIEKFTKVIADISETTNLSREAAATDFARIANVMQEPIENVDRMGAAIVDLGNNFAANEVEISNFAQRISGAGRIAGLTTEDLFAIGTAFSAVGVKAEMGGTAVQKVLNAMTQSVATGDEKLQSFADTAGVTTEEFSQMFKNDASQAFESFVNGLGNQGDAAFKTLEDLELQNERVIRAFLSLSNSGDLINKTFETSAKAFEENNALTEEAAKRYSTFDSQIQILKNTFTNLIEPLGQQLMPVILQIADIFSTQVLPAIEPLIPILGDAMVSALNSIVPLIPKLTDLFVRFTNIFISDLMPVLSPLITLIQNFGFKILDLASNVLTQLIPVLSTFIPIVMEIANIFSDFLIQAIEETLPLLIELAPSIQELLITLLPLLPPLTELAILILKAAVVITQNMIPAINGLIGGLGFIVGPIKTVIEVVSSLVNWLTDLLDVVTKVGGGILGDIFSKIGQFTGGSLNMITEPAMEGIQTAERLASGESSGKIINQNIEIFSENVEQTTGDILQSLKRAGG